MTNDKSIMTGDSLLLHLPDQAVKEVVKLEKGSFAYIIGGKCVGEKGRIEDISKGVIKIKIENKVVEASKDNVFVIGKEKSLIMV
jgi:ribosomal protein S4E